MLGKKVLPSTASLWLYGSRARGTANTESDWDLLILLDEDKQKTTDFVQYAYPFTLMASEEDQMVIPQIYTNYSSDLYQKTMATNAFYPLCQEC